MRALLLCLVLLAACDRIQTAPVATTGDALLAASSDEGPPPPEDFGPDTYRVGVFTGQGITSPGLSCDASSATARRCDGFLPSAVDGTLLDVSIMIPHGPGPHPLVVLIHGYGGSKSSSGDIALALVDEGYAVLRYSTRGFGESWGQVNLVDVHAEVADLRSMIGQVVDHQGFRLSADAVAVTGASYGGGHSWLALLEPRFQSPGGTAVRIRTVVPIAAWSDLFYSLIPNGRPRRSIDRPGGLKLSYVNGLYVSGIRESESRPYPNYPDYFIAWHAWLNAMEPNDIDPLFRQIEDGIAGYRSIWWRTTDFWSDIAAERVPIFQVQGWTDDLFPVTESKRMLLALRTLDPAYPIASYFGDLGHPRAANKTGETEYALDLIRGWLAWYLKGEGSEPAHVIHAAITRPREQPFDPADVITVSTWDALATGSVATSFDGTALLINPVGDPLAGFVWDPLVMEGARELEPLPPPPPSAIDAQSLGVFEVPVAELSGGADMLIAGQPTVRVHASTTAYRVQLNVRLFEVAADGTKHLITRGTYTLDSGTPGVPVGEADVAIPTYGNLWQAAGTSVLRLEITNLDSPYITPSRVPSATLVSDVRLEVPVR